MTRTVVALLTCLIMSGRAASAQEACGLLLRAGINNVYTGSSDFRSRDVFFHNLCMRYEDTVKKGVDFGSETFSAYGYNNLTLSATQAEALARASCETTTSDTAVSNLRSIASSTLSTEALSAWTQCLDLTRQGFEIKPSFRTTNLGYGGHDQLIIQATFKTSVGSSLQGPIVRSVKGTGFTCTGALKDAESRRIDANTSYAVLCTRDTASVPFHVGDDLVYAKAHSVAIDTSAGAIYLTEPPILAAPTVQDLAKRLSALEEQHKRDITALTATIPTGIRLAERPYTGERNHGQRGNCAVGVMTGFVLGDNARDFKGYCAAVELVKPK